MFCIFCGIEIKDWDGEPYILYKNKNICTQCGIDLIEPIYRTNCGGLSHIIFKDMLSSTFNRKKRRVIKNYKKILEELKHKYNFKCCYCNSSENLTIDHIKPVSKGGTDDLSNLQILCKSCNSKKGAK